ncbi:hypothetical protein SLNSH_13670 [Alsobacter soli]|uniref:DUF1214 domain-containing protein n=1 Tax=Alsobacter soli TaxID=2109933 RepID=A0A2T1HSN5_9HYPH|nr:DUF1214 domain-containing protein [Alsobacter soli]PSC04539.1 hypothetical protein SLNSH_13670 [Alsobacter soli]
MTDFALPFSRRRERSPLAAAAAPRPRSALGPFLAVLGIGLTLGLGATWLAVARNVSFGAVEVGPWTAWPRTGALDADPYTKASVARSGEAPLGLGEGLVFTARRDSAGRPLIARCSYAVVGRTPQARYWTLTVQTPGGQLMENPAQRYGFTSAEIVRPSVGAFTIAVSREARPGNWLPTSGDGRFDLVLRLYDTPVSPTGSAIEATAMPRIDAVGCS